MLYLAIDQHAKQITVCVRNEEGDTVLRRQVSTRPEKIEAFFQQLTEMDAEFMAILEVCGFNDWLIEVLRKWNCREIVLIHPEKPSKKKTDRRDAHKLADLLWLNRERLAAGQTVHGLRRVYMVTQKEREDRQLTALRKTLGQRRTRTLNKIHRIINRHNLIWDYPTKSFQTQAGRRWLEKLELPEIDRLEMDMLLEGMEDLGRADCQGGRKDCRTSKSSRTRQDLQPDTNPDDGSRREPLQRPDVGQPNRSHRTLPSASQPGELFWVDSRLPQLGQCTGPTRFDHQRRQQDRAVYLGTAGPALLKARSEDASSGIEESSCVAVRRLLAWR